MKDIQDCIVKTLCAVQPFMAHVFRSCQPNELSNNKCFEILGFDVLLDHNLKSWLLEVNHAPSFSTDTPFDLKVKSQLLSDTFRLIHLDPKKRINFFRKRQIYIEKRLSSAKGAGPRLTIEEKNAKREKKMKKRDEYELKNCGGFTRIFPDLIDNSVYDTCITCARSIWEEFTGCSKKIIPKKEEKKEPASIKFSISPYLQHFDNKSKKYVYPVSRKTFYVNREETPQSKNAVIQSEETKCPSNIQTNSFTPVPLTQLSSTVSAKTEETQNSNSRPHIALPNVAIRTPVLEDCNFVNSTHCHKMNGAFQSTRKVQLNKFPIRGVSSAQPGKTRMAGSKHGQNAFLKKTDILPFFGTYYGKFVQPFPVMSKSHSVRTGMVAYSNVLKPGTANAPPLHISKPIIKAYTGAYLVPKKLEYQPLNGLTPVSIANKKR